ncbi:MAG TPA: hypothetical protein VJ476_10050 [Rhizomicrobium sp.]|nr:hypothetical protein [Rhizomicrobium sp.]
MSHRFFGRHFSNGVAVAALMFAVGVSLDCSLAQGTPPPTTPEPFHSPFNGDKDPTSGEAQDFAKLLDLYDKSEDTRVALAAAKTCGSGVEEAEHQHNLAFGAYLRALDEYVRGYSKNVYPPLDKMIPKGRYGQPGESKDLDDFNDETTRVEDQLRKSDKKQHVAGACPKPQAAPQPPPPPTPPPPAPPPEKPSPPKAEEHWTTPQPPPPATDDAEHRVEMGEKPPTARPQGQPASFAAWHIVDSEFGVNVADFSPNIGNDGTQLGVGGAALVSMTDSLNLDLDVRYNNVSAKSFHLDNVTANASVVWRMGDWNLVPTLGYQNNSAGGASVDTYNLGGYADYYLSDRVTLSGKLLGFTSNPGSDGYDLGGGVTGYVTPNLALRGWIDHTEWSAFGGSSETDYLVGARYRIANGFTLDGTYTYSGFTPGSNFHVNSFFLGLTYHCNGGFDDLQAQDRGGVLPAAPYLTALSLKF